MRKKIAAIALAAVVLVIGIVSATVSYFTDTATSANTFTMGKVSISLTEAEPSEKPNTPEFANVETGTANQTGGYDYNKILPGKVYFKQPTVTVNSDSLDAWLVVTASVPAAYDFDGILGMVNSETAPEHYSNAETGTNYYVFYYDSYKVANDTVTPFKTVKINPSLDDSVQGQSFDVEVRAYSVQKDGFSNVRDAFNAAFGDVRESFGQTFAIQKFSVTASVTKDKSGAVQPVTMSNPDSSIKVDIPAAAINTTATEVKLDIKPAETPAAVITANTNGKELCSYDISVDGLKSGNTQDVTVTIYVGKGLTNVELYHNSTKVNGAAYDASTGCITFQTKDFSPFTVLYHYINVKIGETDYATLKEAIAAVKADETIRLERNTVSEGISVASGKSFTLDLNGKTLSFNKPGAGSAGTKTQGFQLLKDSAITIKNGTIDMTAGNKDFTWSSGDSVKGIAMLIQNYCNLTLDGVTLDGTNIAHNGANVRYVLSNNCGTVSIKDSTIIACDGDFAFDACKSGSYTAPTVTVTGSSVITGKLEKVGTGSIVIEGGTFSTDPKSYIAENYTYEHTNGVWVVSAKS